MSQYDAVRAELQARLTDLVRRVGKMEGDLRRTHDRDWSEQAIEVENDQVLEGLDEMTLAEVRRIREALGRIERGTYGVCTTCGGPIGAQRLAALPSVGTCVGCAS